MTAKTQDFGLWGKKIGMTQVFDEEGDIVPVTVIQIPENIITAIRTEKEDGYCAIQIGAFDIEAKKLTKAEKVSLEKKNLPLLKRLKEFRCYENIDSLKVGDKLDPEEFFKDLKKVDIRGKSIGKGFQGSIKKYNMTVGTRTHGSKSKRIVGSIGAGTSPGHVVKGKRMPSMMGNANVSVTKAKVFKYDPEKRLLLVRSSVPGKVGSIVTITAFGIKTWNHYNKENA